MGGSPRVSSVSVTKKIFYGSALLLLWVPLRFFLASHSENSLEHVAFMRDLDTETGTLATEEDSSEEFVDGRKEDVRNDEEDSSEEVVDGRKEDVRNDEEDSSEEVGRKEDVKNDEKRTERKAVETGDRSDEKRQGMLSKSERCEVDRETGLMKTKSPLRVFVYGPIDAMMKHASAPHSWSCDTYMFGMQTRIPDYFAGQYKWTVTDPKEADLIMFAFYAKCFSKEVLATEYDHITPYQMNRKLVDWYLGNFSAEYPGVLERRGGRDWVFVFPSGNGAYVVPHWYEVIPNAIFLNTEAANTKCKHGNPIYHDADKDIIIPGYYGELAKALAEAQPARKRRLTVSYCGNFETSVQRRKLGELSVKYNNSDRVHIKHWCPVNKGIISESKFCIVPQGWTPWTVRMYEAMIWTCLPVLFGDGFQLPYTKFIPYDKFAIRWPVDQIDERLIEHLESIPVEEVQRRIDALAEERYKVLYDWDKRPNAFQFIESHLQDKFCTWTLSGSDSAAKRFAEERKEKSPEDDGSVYDATDDQ